MKISEMITDRYKLRIPPTVYYDLLADVQEAEEEQEPTTKNDCAEQNGCITCSLDDDCCRKLFEESMQEPTTKNDKEQEDITWIVGNNNVQIAVRNMPVDMMQKICAIIGNKQEVSTKNDEAAFNIAIHDSGEGRRWE